MPAGRIILCISFLGALFFAIFSGTGCANIIPPAGGPRDSLPPVLVKANPADSTRNFRGNKVSFSFNEFIEVQDIPNNLVISPLPRTNPTVDYRLNTVTVKLKDTLEPNVTYSFNFGNAIKDFNEGNVLKGFSYTFSTGGYIDSLELRGKVILAETGKPDSTLIVMLHSSSADSAVVKERPRYISKLDGKGNFVFKNLPPQTFYLYALKDDGGTRRYFNDRQLFAFAGKPVSIPDKPEPITLYAYVSKPAAPAAVPGSTIRSKVLAADKRLRYQTSLVNRQQDLLSNLKITFEVPLHFFDTTKVHLYTDSSFTPVASYHFEGDSSRKAWQLITPWKENTLYQLILEKDFAEDSSGKKLSKPDTIAFSSKKLSEYGSLKLKLVKLDLATNPVLQIMTGETLFKSFPLTGPDVSLALFPPGDYELRILYDENKNGKWDPGEFFGKHKQPELVKPIDRKITVKPDWQNEFEINL